MKDFKFPLLDATDIDVMPKQLTVNRQGAAKQMLLLYKDARCDMRILDAVVGPLNWKREHVIRENVIQNMRTMVNYCKVSIFNDTVGEWVSKEDVGTESNTENAKGEASDAFKRACVNWGIGRELYTSPNIFVDLSADEYDTPQGGKPRLKPWIKFHVSHIAYDETKRAITQLQIVDDKKRIRFSYGVQAQPIQQPQQAPQQPIAPPTLQPLTDVDYDAPTPQDIAKVLAHLNKVRSRADLTKVCTPMMGKAIMQIADVVAKCTEIGMKFPKQ